MFSKKIKRSISEPPKKSKNFISELCFLVIFNIVFGSLFWSLDYKNCYYLVGKLYVITGIIYAFWLCIISITHEGCEKFKVYFCYIIEIANSIMTIIFFIKLVYMANSNHFCSEASLKILTYVFLGIVFMIFLVLLSVSVQKYRRKKRNDYNQVNQRV